MTDVRERELESVSSPVLAYLERLHDECKGLRGGDVATYIPQLGEADPDSFAICIVTVGGYTYEVGDVDHQFTIQSISKALTYGLALEDLGVDAVSARVGVEPTGDPFNSITVDEVSNRPFNPMVNAGAIVTTSLVRGDTGDDKLGRLLDAFGRFIGHDVAIDADVFNSERETGDRNRAIAYLMRNFGMLDGDVEQMLDLYFRQCSFLVTCRDLAVAGATLANRGRNPITGEPALSSRYVGNVLSVMQTCGMYDFAGEWTYTVGLPAKSGVSGGIMAVLPGQLGIGVFSPPLDARGNSVRGIEVCRRLSHDFALHPHRPATVAGGVVRRRYRAECVRSARARSVLDEAVLQTAGARVVVHELQGDLFFATTEVLVREVLDDLEGVEHVVIDGRRVGRVDSPARELLSSMGESLSASGRTVLLAGFASEVTDALEAEVLVFDDADGALEWCEQRALASVPRPQRSGPLLHDQQLLQGLGPDELAAVAERVELRELVAGETVFHEGEPADTVCFVVEGAVSVRLPLAGGRSHRVAGFGAGMAVGDFGLVERAPRSADVVADEISLLAAFPIDDLAVVDAKFPGVAAQVYANLARLLAQRLRNANDQIRSLDS
ncbi:MAG TPA: glutaminase A [Acidimicrobiia bacterium]|nr:glutaminase A [Acidimicrobiia bacterium]